MSGVALEVANITQRYDTVLALDDVSLRVREGSVHALLGENGAGKTTLMRIAFGLITPDRGTISVRGVPQRLRSPADAARAGIGMVHQHFTLVPALTVAENLSLGRKGMIRRQALAERVRDVAARSGFVLTADARVQDLSVGAQQRVEIAKALSVSTRILILDEPTAVLAPGETVELMRWMRGFADSGGSVVLITHKLDEALGAADDVTVLRHGRVALSGRVSAVARDAVAAAIVGEAAPYLSGSSPVASASGVTFRATGLAVTKPSGAKAIRDASFAIKAGELIGVVAIEGAGHHELLRALAGRIEPSGGTLERPADVGFVPEDRHRDAVLLDQSLVSSVALKDSGRRRGRMPWAALRNHSDAIITAFDVRATSAQQAVRSLSGGNQQKLVLGRELLASPGGRPPRALIVENPTRGLDLRASGDVLTRLRDAARDGVAVVFYSSDLDEVLRIATRVLVVFGGEVIEPPLERDAIARAMIGVSPLFSSKQH